MSRGPRLSKHDERPAAPILIVESDSDLSTVLRDVLEGEGFSVETAQDVAGAHAVLTRVRPAVVLLDLRLQGETAEALLAELSDRQNPQTTVAVAGSKTSTDVAVEYGVISVGKPFDIDELVDRIRHAIIEGPGMLDRSPRRQSSPGGG